MASARYVSVFDLLQRADTRVVVALAAFGIVGSLSSMAGWVLDLPRFANWTGDGISIQPNAALSASGISIGILLLVLGRSMAAAVVAAIVAAAGALTALENLCGLDVGIDGWLLFGRDWGSRGTVAPGRMGLPASASWAALGISLLLIARGAPRVRAWAPRLALLPLAVSLLSILGFAYDAGQLYTVPGVTAISLQTAIFIFALSLATVALADTGPITVFGNLGPAGIAARRFLPFVFLIPVLTGSLRLAGERAGLYDTAFGVALHNLVEITLLLALLWWTGRAIARHYAEREKAEAGRLELLVLEQAARREAERQATIRDEFLATLSHELRTPLNAILGWAQILKTDVGDADKVAQAVEVIERNARLQAHMIADLLDVSRILSGKMRLHVQPVDLAAVIDAALDAVAPAANAKGVRIERVLEPMDDVVNGDAGRLQQVVWNLLTNAVKFTPRGGKVQVVLARVNSHVEVRVSDTGEGIAPEFLPKLFERFRQADATTARVHGGLGLGLALVKQLVELHGGKVTAASDGLGRGAMFSVHLPLAAVYPRDGEARVHPLAAPIAPSNTPLPRLDTLSILLVDDDADSLQMVAALFEGQGALVATAANAAEALELAVGRRFDAIVSDIGMPGRDGYELMKECRARGVTAPAVALTAYARSEDRTKALSSGYQSHVAKPVDAAELLATVYALTRRMPAPQ
jgi:signal transduction histidine kinase/ActR/RegA family two-component response regulator